jgi:uncharacterized damage-inducible protein DinB
MNANLDRLFLDCSAGRLLQIASRIETCLASLDQRQAWMRGGENQNAVGNLVLHLCGNVRQWIVSGVGGRPDIRDRDSEFAAREGLAPDELARRLHETVEEAAAVLSGVTAERLAERVVIQQYEISVLEAIYHVVEHFSMHAGQIIFATKMSTGRDLGFYAHLNSAAAHGERTP